MEDFKQALAKKAEEAEESLEMRFDRKFDAPDIIVSAMRYSLFAGGKRLRPVLMRETMRALGDDPEKIRSLADAIEMIHTYSLIHDDLPSMDNDDFRRGKPACHKVFGENMAILAGDALLTEAFVLLSRAEKVMFSAERRLAIIQEIANAAGINGMVGGQALDVISVTSGADEIILQDIHRRKTGALIVAAVKSGAVMFNAGKDKIQALTEYGMNVGLAFQIADDILNVEGDSRLMGKGTGSDAARNKLTYPSLMGLQQAKEKLNQHVEAAVASLADFDERAMPLKVIARYIRDRNS